MSDPRFARLKTDPRFRKPRKKANKIVIDDRFKSIFDGAKNRKGKASVDKYGRKISSTNDSDNLRRFYRLGQEEELPGEDTSPDYARGEILMESSDEDEQPSESDDDDVILGRDVHKPIKIASDNSEIDLDESQFAELDALAKVNATKSQVDDASGPSGEQTNRLAVVNLDWDHVRASHLFKICSSVISPASREREKRPSNDLHGKVLKVQIFPSEFGKVRLERERKEGPPKELFKNHGTNDEVLNLEDDGNDYNEEALRTYQLERLRYYYAIITCDTVDAAAHIYAELDGTELERSANVFNLSFVPNDMTFDDNVYDEASQDSTSCRGVEFVTDALRHSKVRLTWDDDDPERNKITRRTLSRKEIDESDFKAYLASSGSSDEGSDAEDPSATKRDKMRALLLGGTDEDNVLLPEGWGKEFDKAGELEITFTPGLSGNKEDAADENETTLQRYLRKQKERRKKKTAKASEGKGDEEAVKEDDFFGEDSEDEGEKSSTAKKEKSLIKRTKLSTTPKHIESTAAELELLVSSVEPSREPKHFDMRSVLKAEKNGSKKRSKKDKKKKGAETYEDDAQEDFTINVKDERFKALHEDHSFAIDPSNPHFKKTKSMSALLEERTKRQKLPKEAKEQLEAPPAGEQSGRNLKSLVESVKRKSSMAEEGGGKRRKL